MFYSGWQFRTPTCFDLTGRTAAMSYPGATVTAAPGAADPPSGGSGISAIPLGILTGASHNAAGEEPVVYQRIEKGAPTASLATTPVAGSSAKAGKPLSPSAGHLNGGAAPAPALKNKGVVHLQFSTPVTFVTEGGEAGAAAAAAAAAAAGRAKSHASRGGHSAFHVRSDCPLMPQLGVAYMEVQIEKLPRSERESTKGSGAMTSASPPLGLVVGICSDALPARKLPGEQDRSIGLFYSQSMVYSNGLGEGERVSLLTRSSAAPGATAAPGNASETRAGSPLPATEGVGGEWGPGSPPLQSYFRLAADGSSPTTATGTERGSGSPGGHPSLPTRGRRRELREGDTLGVLVDFIEGSVRFTYNGELVEGYTGAVERAERSEGGRWRQQQQHHRAAVSTATTVGISQARKAPNSAEGGGGGGGGGANDYYFALGLQRSVTGPVTFKVVFQSGVLPVPGVHVLASLPRFPGPSAAVEGPPSGTDLVVFDLARYATKEAERKLKGQYPRLCGKSWCEGELDDRAVQAMLRQFFVSRGLSKTLASLEREISELSPQREEAHRAENPQRSGLACPAEKDALMSYSDFIDTARKLVLGTAPQKTQGGLLSSSSSSSSSSFSPSLVLEHHCLLPMHRAVFYSALGKKRADQTPAATGFDIGGELLSPHFWGLLLFSRRMDLLFTLKAMQAAELVLETCEKYLAHIQERYGPRSAAPANGGKTKRQRSTFDCPAAVESRLLAAYSTAVILPMQEIAKRATVKGGGSSSASTMPSSSHLEGRASSASKVGQAHSWQDLAQLPQEALRESFFDYLNAAEQRNSRGNAAEEAEEEEEGVTQVKKKGSSAATREAAFPSRSSSQYADHRGRAEAAATVLLTAAIPLLAAPTTATQLRLGETMVSFFSHTQAFFSQLTQGPLSGRKSSRSRRDSIEDTSTSQDSEENNEENESAQYAYADEAAPKAAGAVGGHSCDTELLMTCLVNWSSLINKARQQYRRRAYALLQRSLEECNQWVGVTLSRWLSEKEALGREEARDNGHPARASDADPSRHRHRGVHLHNEEEEEGSDEEEEAVADYSTADDCGDERKGDSGGEAAPAAPARDGLGGEVPGVLACLTRAPAIPSYISAESERPNSSMVRLPPGHPSLRALYRRCLATASLDPIAQVSTNFFMTKLSAAGRRVATERTVLAARARPAGPSGRTAEDVPSPFKRAAASPSAAAASVSAAGAYESREGWAADEFYLASVYLQRVYRCLFP